MDERERLEKVVVDGYIKWRNGFGPADEGFAGVMTEHLLKAGVTLPPKPTPRPVWPGLEGEGLRTTTDIGMAAYDAAAGSGCQVKDMDRAYHTAVTAHLFRALVAGLPRLIGFPSDHVLIGGAAIPRDDLAALADPYDGGGK